MSKNIEHEGKSEDRKFIENQLFLILNRLTSAELMFQKNTVLHSHLQEIFNETLQHLSKDS